MYSFIFDYFFHFLFTSDSFPIHFFVHLLFMFCSFPIHFLFTFIHVFFMLTRVFHFVLPKKCTKIPTSKDIFLTNFLFTN